jgi:FMN phosphatase YigB (HAD superfamily)
VDGAKRAGLQAVWLNRRNATYPDFFETPDATGETLTTLVEVLLSGA